jgi:hypothetical protein
MENFLVVREKNAPGQTPGPASDRVENEEAPARHSRSSRSKLTGVGGQIWNLVGLIGGGTTAVSPHSSVFLAGNKGSVK